MGGTKRLVKAHVVVVREMQHDRSLQVLQLLAECVCQTRKAPHSGEVLFALYGKDYYLGEFERVESKIKSQSMLILSSSLSGD